MQGTLIFLGSSVFHGSKKMSGTGEVTLSCRSGYRVPDMSDLIQFVFLMYFQSNTNMTLCEKKLYITFMATCVRPARVTPIYLLIGRSGNSDLALGELLLVSYVNTAYAWV